MSLNRHCVIGLRRCNVGVVGLFIGVATHLMVMQVSSRRGLESRAIEGNGPVGERHVAARTAPEYGGARGILSESARTTSQG